MSASTNSREDYRVEWDPAVHKQREKKAQGLNARRDSRHKAGIGMEYLQVRRELALELPFSSQDGQRPRKPKKDAKDEGRGHDPSRNQTDLAEAWTPLSELSARALPGPPHGNEDLPAREAKGGAGSGAVAHSRQQEPAGQAASQALQMSFSNQLAAGSEPPKAALQRELMGPREVVHALRPEEQKSQPTEQAKEAPKEKRKRLVQLQKKNWQQKEKEKLQSQISEQ